MTATVLLSGGTPSGVGGNESYTPYYRRDWERGIVRDRTVLREHNSSWLYQISVLILNGGQSEANAGLVVVDGTGAWSDITMLGELLSVGLSLQWMIH